MLSPEIWTAGRPAQPLLKCGGHKNASLRGLVGVDSLPEAAVNPAAVENAAGAQSGAGRMTPAFRPRSSGEKLECVKLRPARSERKMNGTGI